MYGIKLINDGRCLVAEFGVQGIWVVGAEPPPSLIEPGSRDDPSPKSPARAGQTSLGSIVLG